MSVAEKLQRSDKFCAAPTELDLDFALVCYRHFAPNGAVNSANLADAVRFSRDADLSSDLTI